jgi:hypothetical protein
MGIKGHPVDEECTIRKIFNCNNGLPENSSLEDSSPGFSDEELHE